MLVLLAACDRDAWSPRAEHARATRDLAASLAAHLETLPGVTRASVLLDEARPDPLAPPAPSPPPRASIVLAVTGDPDAITAAARTAALASIRGLTDAHLVVTARPTPSTTLASVGPFDVAPSSRAPLVATLAGALLLIAALAGWIAITGARRRRR